MWLRAGKTLLAYEIPGGRMELQSTGICDYSAGVASGFILRLTITYYGNRINS